MDNKLVIKVNGVTIKNPAEFTMGREPITDANRLLSGKMSIKGIAPKLVFELKYNSITNEEFEKITGVTWDVFVSSKQIEADIEVSVYGKTYSLRTYFNPHKVSLDAEMLKLGRWKDFDIKFIEL